MVYAGWRGYLISGFALVWVANVYMSIFARLRLNIKRERVEISAVEADVKQAEENNPAGTPDSANRQNESARTA
jgi:hypothetical protein